MEFTDYIRLVLLTSFVVEGAIEGVNPEHLKGYNKICHSITSEPFFERDLAVSTAWTVFYSWNMKLPDSCPEVKFRYPNETSVNRIYSQMYKHLITQPPWPEAVLDVLMDGRVMLLFNDPSGVTGRFLGVPFMADIELKNAFNNTKMPILEMSIKLLEGGKYLVSSSCHVGGGTVFAVRRRHRPRREEIDEFATNYDFGKRYPTCLKPF